MRDKGLPALSIALVDGSHIVWARGFGEADPVRHVPATAATVYRVGSVSKLFTDIGITSTNPLHPRFVRQPVTEQAPALIDLLRGDAIDELAIKSLAREAKELLQGAEGRRAAREDRLRALGFEDPSNEQRREQLARNVAMRDWPKT